MAGRRQRRRLHDPPRGLVAGHRRQRLPDRAGTGRDHGLAGGIPAAPGPLSASVTGRDVWLRWDPPASGAAPSAYRLEVGANPRLAASLALTVAAPSTGLHVPGAPPGVYFVRVRAGNAAGVGPPSAPVPVLVDTPGAPHLVAERVDANPVALS